MKDRRVVLIMPVYNEARHLPQVLQSLSAQTFDRNRLFFVAVDGGSNDGSADLLQSWMSGSGIAGEVLINRRRKIPISLNLGLSRATDEDFVLRMDGHTAYGPTYVADAVAAVERAPADVACIGCAQRPASAKTLEERIVGALYTNPMGLGGSDFRCGDDVREVDNVYLGAWRPGILTRSGGFNEAMEANEDAEICARVRKAGYRILRVPLPCECFMKRGVVASVRQWHRYGYWRAKMLRRNPEFVRVRHIVNPVAALVVGAVVFSPLRVLLLPAFASYALLVFRGRPKAEPFGITLATLAYFPVLQFGFAAGMFRGLLSEHSPDWPPPQPVQECS